MVISILIAGEDAGRRARLASPLIFQGYYIVEAESGERSFDLLKRRPNIALALLDVEMADISGVDFIANIRAAGLKMPIIALSSNENDERLRRATEAGADDFLIYPISAERLSVSVGNLLQKQMLRHNSTRPRLQEEIPMAVSKWVSKSAAMREILDKAVVEAHEAGILLICGEDGTGREALARAIHEERYLYKTHTEPDQGLRSGIAAGDRGIGNSGTVSHAAAPFVYIDCRILNGSIKSFPDRSTLMENRDQAQGGTLCFGNIDMLDKMGQSQFLQFIERQFEEGHIKLKKAKDGSAGGSKSADVIFGLMATACAHLDDLVAEGSFSIGLYKRLSTYILAMPPLRDRREDIGDIAHYMLARLVSETGHSKLNGLSGAATALLSQYDWPGNFTELENVLFRAVMLSEGRLLAARDFPGLAEMGEEQNRLNTVPAPAVSQQLFYDASGHMKQLGEIEKEAILEAMKRYRGKISEVARRLKIGRSTLYRKLEDYGLYPERD